MSSCESDYSSYCNSDGSEVNFLPRYLVEGDANLQDGYNADVPIAS